MKTGQITGMVSGHGGWVRFQVLGVVGDIYVQMTADAAGRLRVGAVLVDGRGEHVEASHLRSLPLAQLEGQANARGVRRAIESNLDVEVDLVGRIARGPFGGMRDDEGDPPPPAQRKPRPLVVPGGRSYPDAFYDRVAQHYRWWSGRGSRPAAGIAEEVGVPPSTVHRWVREARKRGHLPPARRGAAG